MSLTPDPSITTGLILVDHGSKKSAANLMLDDVVAMFKRVSGEKIVEVAHMELAEPSIPQAFDACVAQGAQLVIIHPYFLSPGRHSTTDIPRIVEEAAAQHPSVKFHVTQPLGLDERLAQIIIERVKHCLAHQFSCGYCSDKGCCSTNALASCPTARQCSTTAACGTGCATGEKAETTPLTHSVT